MAAVLIGDRSEVDRAGLARRLAAELSSYKVPRRIAVVTAAEVPLLPSGKVDVRGLAVEEERQYWWRERLRRCHRLLTMDGSPTGRGRG